MQITKFRTLAALAFSALAIALVGCQKEGPAEKAGKEIDNAISSAGKQIQQAGDSIKDAAK